MDDQSVSRMTRQLLDAVLSYVELTNYDDMMSQQDFEGWLSCVWD
jgi:hypothetical protein